MKRNRQLPIVIMCILLLILNAGCGQGGAAGTGPETAPTGGNAELSMATKDIFAMDTVMTVTCYGDRADEALTAAEGEIQRLDALLSVGNNASEISAVNASGSGRLSEDTLSMTKTALEIYESSGGAFDITVYPVMELWGFTKDECVLPDPASLTDCLTRVGADRLTLEGDLLTLGEGQGIDLGGIAKGYTSGRLMEIFREYDIVSGLVSLGGNVQCYGTKPDSSLWRIGVRDPGSSGYFGVISTADRAVITSGGYERFFIGEDGRTYHHIIDPATGYPAENGLISVTIVSSDGTLADALSTACYVLGPEGAAEYWRQYGERFDMVLMDENGAVYVTETLAEDFTSSLPADVTVNVIKK